MQTPHPLPTNHWIFDIDDEEDDKIGVNSQPKSLLEELEIDPTHIYRNIVWMFVGPFFKMIGRPYKRHPLYISSSNINKQSIDFWGPCTIVVLYCLLLSLNRVKDVGWIFVIWTVAAVMNHFVSRVFFRSSLMIHTALLGYSITPIIPFAAIILLLRPPLWLATILEFLSVVWASTSAIYSYSTIVSISAENKPKLKLLYPTVILMELYITSLMPIRKWQS